MPKIVRPSFVIETQFDGATIIREIEKFARNCYKSEGKIEEGSTEPFVRKLLHVKKHAGIADHHAVTVRLIVDRGVSHEVVRHRIGAYLQESTRFCDYAKVGEIQVISPEGHMTNEQYAFWWQAMQNAEFSYNKLRELGCKPEIARSVLPNSLKTEIIMTLNLTSWRNFFKQRTAPNAHPQMREIAIPLLAEFKRRIPIIFDDIVMV